jgi:hypothetical protein
MTAKVRIKAGPVELEFETEAGLSLDDIKSLLKDVEALSPVASVDSLGAGSATTALGNSEGGSKAAGSHKLFVTSIAAKLGAKTGADLAWAAAGQLELTDGKESFTRQELLATMKKAPKYYKAAMSKNLTSIIMSLIPEKLNQIGTDVYSLTVDAHSALEAALA